MKYKIVVKGCTTYDEITKDDAVIKTLQEIKEDPFMNLRIRIYSRIDDEHPWKFKEEK